MKKTLLSLLLLSSFALFVMQSCKKNDESPSDDNDIVAAEDNAYAEGVFADAFNMMDAAARENSGFNKNGNSVSALNACATVTADTSVNPRKLTIDFGTGCLGNDGRTRTGKIVITFTGRYRTAGTVIKFTFDNYTVNGHKVEGEKTVTNMGENASGNLYFKIEVKNAKITTENGVISWESTREREWVAGRNTLDISDDEYQITGSAKGTNRKGNKFDINITNALLIKIGCKWITKGTVEVKPEGKLVRTVDYGNGNCDNLASVTVANRTYNFQMR